MCVWVCARAEKRCCSCGRYLVLSRVFANRSRPTHQAAGRQQRDVTQSVAFRLRSKSPARTLPLYSRPMDRFPPIISNRLDGKSLLKMYTAIDRGDVFNSAEATTHWPATNKRRSHIKNKIKDKGLSITKAFIDRPEIKLPMTIIRL